MRDSSLRGRSSSIDVPLKREVLPGHPIATFLAASELTRISEVSTQIAVSLPDMREEFLRLFTDNGNFWEAVPERPRLALERYTDVGYLSDMIFGNFLDGDSQHKTLEQVLCNFADLIGQFQIDMREATQAFVSDTLALNVQEQAIRSLSRLGTSAKMFITSLEKKEGAFAVYDYSVTYSLTVKYSFLLLSLASFAVELVSML